MDKLYYISQGITLEAHYHNIKKVCENGVKLVQLRVKNFDKEELLELAYRCKKCCEYYGVTLIINDHIWLAKILGVGVHLGKNDQDIRVAKKELKEGGLIGGTANTLEDCLYLIDQGIDYIGLGPFRFTKTKKKLSPILGIKGCQNILESLKLKGLQVPIYVIGGVTTADFELLLQTSIQGIAVSGLLTGVPDDTIEKICNEIINYENIKNSR